MDGPAIGRDHFGVASGAGRSEVTHYGGTSGSLQQKRHRAEWHCRLSGRIATHKKFYFSIHDGQWAVLRESCCRSFFAKALKAPVRTPTDSRGPWLGRTRHRIAVGCEIDRK